MKLDDVILEATYGSLPEEIAKKIFNKVYEKIKLGKKFLVDITEYFPESKRQVNFLFRATGADNDRTTAEVIINRFSYDLFFYRNYKNTLVSSFFNEEKVKKSFLKTIGHEVIHIMDLIRNQDKMRTSKLLKTYGDAKRYEKELTSIGVKSRTAYYANELELNRLFNQFVEYLKKNENEIKTKKDLLNLLGKFDGEKATGKAFTENEGLFRSLILRLNREGVLPKELK